MRARWSPARGPLPCCRVVSQCTAGLPEGKPRYVMGVGYPLDIVICSGEARNPLSNSGQVLGRAGYMLRRAGI